MGAKMPPRLTTFRHEGGFASRPPARDAPDRLPPLFGTELLVPVPVRSAGRRGSSSRSTARSTPSSSTYTRSYSCRFSLARLRRCFWVAMGGLCRPLERHRSVLDDGVDDVSGEVIGDMPPVSCVEQDDIGCKPGVQPADPIRTPEHVGGVDGRG